MVLFFGMIAFAAVVAVFLLAIALFLAFADYLGEGFSFHELSAVVAVAVFFVGCYYGPRIFRAAHRYRLARKVKYEFASARAKYRTQKPNV